MTSNGEVTARTPGRSSDAGPSRIPRDAPSSPPRETLPVETKRPVTPPDAVGEANQSDGSGDVIRKRSRETTAVADSGSAHESRTRRKLAHVSYEQNVSFALSTVLNCSGGD